MLTKITINDTYFANHEYVCVSSTSCEHRHALDNRLQYNLAVKIIRFVNMISIHMHACCQAPDCVINIGIHHSVSIPIVALTQLLLGILINENILYKYRQHLTKNVNIRSGLKKNNVNVVILAHRV